MARRLAKTVLWLVLGVGLFGDCIASDRPIVLKLDGQTYWLANVIDYKDIGELTGTQLRARMNADDWAIWAPVRADPLSVRTAGRLEPAEAPSSSHALGTDDRGRDVLARFIHGARPAIWVGAGAALLSTILALFVAVFAAGGRPASRSLWLGGCDAISAVPAIVVVIAARGLLGRGGLFVVILFVAIPRGADAARMAIAAAERALDAPFCTAARALGASRWRVLLRHALPHAMPQVAVAAALTAATAVLAEAALSYLGFGVAAPAASWGELLRQAHDNGIAWWLALPPGLAIAAVAAALGALAQPKSR